MVALITYDNNFVVKFVGGNAKTLQKDAQNCFVCVLNKLFYVTPFSHSKKYHCPNYTRYCYRIVHELSYMAHFCHKKNPTSIPFYSRKCDRIVRELFYVASFSQTKEFIW